MSLLIRILFSSLFFLSFVTTRAQAAKLVVSVPYLAELVGEVTCDAKSIQVETLVPATLNPHNYSLTPKDRANLESADLILAIGNHFEPWLERTGAKLSKKTIAITDHLKLEGQGNKHLKVGDPHVWHSPVLTSQAAQLIAEHLKKTFPTLMKDSDRCFLSFQQKVESHLAQLKAVLRELPEYKRVFVTTHKSMAYFADFFGFKMIALGGVSHHEGRSPGALKRTIQEVKTLGARAAFPEVTEPSKDLEQLAKTTGIKMGAPLYVDGLGPKGSGAETTGGLWIKNMNALVEGLK